MIRILAVSALLMWAGLTLLLHRLRWFSRTPLAERLAPYVPGGMGVRPRAGVLSVGTTAAGPPAISRSSFWRMALLKSSGSRTARMKEPGPPMTQSA